MSYSRVCSTNNNKRFGVSDMSQLTSDFSDLRMSALRKASKISSAVTKVTIGPHSDVKDESPWSDNRENEKNTCNVDISSEISKEPTKITKQPTRSGVTFSMKKILLENELQRREEVRKVIEERKRAMERSRKALQEDVAIMRSILTMKREREEAEELARLEAEEERLAQQSEIRRKHEQQLQAQRIRERKERLEREAEEQRKSREKAQEELVNRLLPLYTAFREKCQRISSVTKGCKDKVTADAALGPLANQLKAFNQQMEAISTRSRCGDITTADLEIAESIERHSEQILAVCKSEIDRIDTLYEAEIARCENEMKAAEAVEEAARLAEARNAQQGAHAIQQSNVFPGQVDQGTSSVPLIPPNDKIPNKPESIASATDSSSIETAIDETDGNNLGVAALQTYMNTHMFLNNYAAQYRDLAQAAGLKKFRFECQKAINIPVNGISGINGMHLKDKYETLRSLIMGKSSFNITQHPQGIPFCKDILAKKIVSQGETLISSKPEMAFPVAAVAVALWSDFPDFGELLLAHFRRACPYILPVFLPRLEGQTNEEYYKSLGYKYTEDGTVEKQDKYLTRMTGLMRLYASIIVTKQRRGCNTPHPHGIQNAWRWLAITLNSEHRPDLTDACATMILDMLEVTGNALLQTYPRQFSKMLVLLETQYYRKMQNEAGIGGGPMTRLGQFLKDSITKRMIPPPEGLLSPDFW